MLVTISLLENNQLKFCLVAQDGIRQWFRLVSEEIDGWFSQHNTPNPLGIEPTAPIVYYNKFL